MKTFNYSPEFVEFPDVEGRQPSGFTGNIVVQMPIYKDRLAFIRSLSKLSDGESAEQTIGYAEKHVVSVDVTHVESGQKFTTFDDLGMVREGVAIINDLSRQLLQGISLGNISKPQ